MMRCCYLTWVAGLVAVLVTGGRCEPLLTVSNAPHNTLTLDAHHTLHLVHPKGASSLPSVTLVRANSRR